MILSKELYTIRKRTIERSESLEVFLAKSKIRLNAPLVRILARLQLSCASIQIIVTQCLSSESDRGCSSVRVSSRHATDTASVSLEHNNSWPFDFDKLERIFNDCARNGLPSLAKHTMQLMLFRFA